ncbi:MAG TPA: biopolymer transporter ExbD [Caldithrix abyssi]|uniref:Biopolymer transporter ExbD n=1 Tax=Caldithrix abyssi TaxID=187145 RepID=A0A7V1PUJ4_CALAY|nr:biopolymer transporter ExbD [Caldithrix abyssi]
MAFQPSKSKRHMEKEEGQLNMNSMMDMMTIILLFLLKSFSTEGALVTQSADLTLPESVIGEKPKKELQVSVTKNDILVNNKRLMSLSDIDPESVVIAPLFKNLTDIAQGEKQLEIDVGKEFTHTVIIQGDEDMHFDILYKVMYTCSKSEYYKMRLLTVKKG